MNIWIDGDACPKQVKQILFRAATTRKVPLLMVANHFVTIPPSPFIKRIIVESGFDKADQYILEHINKYDLAITGDTLLAELILEKEAFALNSRGLLYTQDNIKHIVTMRNINESLRSSGMVQGGPAQLQQKDIVSFSNHLDRIITKFHQA
jgi:uncharacterized protein YaiI (UPF0178 family)